MATPFLLKVFGMGYPGIYADKYKIHRHHFLKAVISKKEPLGEKHAVESVLKIITIIIYSCFLNT